MKARYTTEDQRKIIYKYVPPEERLTIAKRHGLNSIETVKKYLTTERELPDNSVSMINEITELAEKRAKIKP